MQDGTKFWERVDFLRNRTSIRELCELTGLSERTVQSTRSTKQLPKMIMAYPIAQFLDTTMDYLYSGVDPKDKWDGELFQKIASNQDYVDICNAMFTADDTTIEMIKRILQISNNKTCGMGGGLLQFQYRGKVYTFVKNYEKAVQIHKA